LQISAGTAGGHVPFLIAAREMLVLGAPASFDGMVVGRRVEKGTCEAFRGSLAERRSASEGVNHADG
jgi:hypothetical protein